ncbi:MAG TPA: hypothetical protein VKU36_05365 [Candidatus Babeliales bacterium]|nr:hypothetical protein [Candidatus Babeliales bacterium]
MRIKGCLIAVVALAIFSANVLKPDFRSTYNDLEYSFSGVFKPESFFGKNTNWFNNDNDFDKSYVSKHVLDLALNAWYGAKTYGEIILEFMFQVRNKGIWGSPESIASTTFADIRVLDAIRGTHRHAFPRHVFWIRQLWMSFDIGKAFNMPFKNKHTFMLGAFPFQLGRGIALGDAYATGPEILGFWSDSFVDQYAFGAKFSGEIFPKIVSYDLYTAILQNSSTGIADTEKVILAQEFGGFNKPQRGFGKINYIVAGRLSWNVFDNAWLGRLTVEPYGLYNNDPEQKVEFPADASSKLGTTGLAGEFYGKRFECGFDYAVNFGQQRVKGWDRNIVKENNRNAVVVLINDNVTANYTNLEGQPASEPAPFVPGSDAQKIINTTDRDEAQNGQVIGNVSSLGYLLNEPGTPIVLKNSKGRFGNAYTNKYQGWMFVADAGYSFCKNKDLFVAVAGGVASGDDNPNFNTKDGTYDGFIGLQESYSGKRVRSVFLLGGAGKAKRLLSTPGPEDLQAPSTKAQAVSGFTNLVFCGTALRWKPSTWKKPFEINPNVYSFWQQHPIGNARTYLGTEGALFINYSLFKDLKIFWVSSLFFPGSHYKDRMGTPVFTREEMAFFETDNPTGRQDRIPGLGKNVAYTFNLGLIYTF